MKHILGRSFLFTCSHGSHRHILCGSITSIKFSDESGLKLYVTSPEIWGRKILCFSHHSKNGWAAYFPTDPKWKEQLDALPEDAAEDEEDALSIASIEDRFMWGEFSLL